MRGSGLDRGCGEEGMVFQPCLFSCLVREACSKEKGLQSSADPLEFWCAVLGSNQ